MALLAESLLATEVALATEAREYLLMSAMSGRLASRQPEQALRLWREQSARVRASAPAFRLLRCHADPAGCAADFAAYAVR
jgi:hypothetical protein